ERRGVTVDELVDRREDAALDQLADHVRGIHTEQLGQLLDGDRRGKLDGATLARIGDLDSRLREGAVAPLRLAGPAPAAGAASATRQWRFPCSRRGGARRRGSPGSGP